MHGHMIVKFVCDVNIKVSLCCWTPISVIIAFNKLIIRIQKLRASHEVEFADQIDR
jgi:hypothetical protein